MNPETLLTHFGRLVEAPGAVARLKRFVFELAVHGRLVPQHEDDEPVFELIERIRATRARLVTAGALKKLRVLPPISEPPFALPASWCWTRLGDVTSGRPHTIPQEAFTYIDVSSVDRRTGRIRSLEICQANAASNRARKTVHQGDVIYSCVRPTSSIAAVVDQFYDPPPIASTAFAILDSYGQIDAQYLWMVLRSPFVAAWVKEAQTGNAYPEIKDASLALLPIPIAPLGEQRRIRTKFAELMRLLQDVETSRETRELARDRFTTANLARFEAPGVKAAENAGLLLNHFRSLTTRPDQIKRVRQTIADLAVQGMLVPQEAHERVCDSILKESTGPSLPPNWRSLPLAKHFHILAGRQPSSTAVISTSKPGYIQLLHPRDFREVSQPTYIPLSRDNAVCRGGDLLIERFGASAGRVRWAEDGAFSRGYYRFVWPTEALLPQYCYLLLGSFYFRRAVVAGTIPSETKFDKASLAQTAVPVPPLDEQRRIVARTTTLVDCCDRLETALARADSTRVFVLSALLDAALGGKLLNKAVQISSQASNQDRPCEVVTE